MRLYNVNHFFNLLCVLMRMKYSFFLIVLLHIRIHIDLVIIMWFCSSVVLLRVKINICSYLKLRSANLTYLRFFTILIAIIALFLFLLLLFILYIIYLLFFYLLLLHLYIMYILIHILLFIIMCLCSSIIF